jgi:hypothetical protein
MKVLRVEYMLYELPGIASTRSSMCMSSDNVLDVCHIRLTSIGLAAVGSQLRRYSVLVIIMLSGRLKQCDSSEVTGTY